MSQINGISYLGTDYDIGASSYYVTPQDYGAKGDGTTDDTLAIQNCIRSNYTVCFPKGHYRITSPITLTHNQCMIFGAEPNNTRIKCDGCGGFIIPNGREKISISSITIYGSNASDENGIVFEGGATDITLNGLAIKNFGLSAILSNTEVDNSHVTDIDISKCEISTGTYGIEFLTSASSQHNSIHIHDNVIHYFTYGILITGNGIVIDNNDIEVCDYSVCVDSSFSNSANSYRYTQDIVIMGNYIDKMVKGFVKINPHYTQNDQGLVDSVFIVGNYAYTSVTYGTESDPVYDFRSTANPYSGEGYESSDYGYTLSNVFFAGNHITLPSALRSTKPLIDGGGVMGNDCSFHIGLPGNNSASNQYIIQNMGNADVRYKFQSKTRVVKLYKNALPNGTAIDADGISLPASSTYRFEIPVDDIIRTIDFTANGTATITIYGYLVSDGSKVLLNTISVTGSETDVSLIGSDLTDDYTYHMKQFDNYEFVVATTAITSITNPAVVYMV